MSAVLLEETGPLACITLSGPARNALSLAMQTELRDALAGLVARGATRLLVIRGANGAFCSGAALGDLAAAEGQTLGETVSGLMHTLSNPLIMDLQSAPFATLSVVEGSAAGAGASLALATDLTLAAESAFFLLPFAPNLGLMPDLGASHMLVERLGRARAMGIALLGGRIPAAQAAGWGLIWASVPDQDLEAQLKALCEALLRAPADMAPGLRRLFDAAQNNSLDAQMALEADTQKTHLDSAAFEEGRRAFLEKRPAEFHKPA